MAYKSPIVSALNSWADTKSLSINNFQSFAADIDRQFELEEIDGKLFAIRKATQQAIPFDDSFAKQVLRPVINDKSFGTFRSRIKAGPVDADMKGKTQSLLDDQQLIFKDKITGEKILGFIRDNFIVDGSSLRRYDATTGYISSQPVPVDFAVQQYASRYLDEDRTVIAKAEKAAFIRNEAKRLAASKTEEARLFEAISRVNIASFEPVSVEAMHTQQADIKARAMANLGVIDEKLLTTAETQQLGVLINAMTAKLNNLPEGPTL